MNERATEFEESSGNVFADAMVWALTELMIRRGGGEPRVRGFGGAV